MQRGFARCIRSSYSVPRLHAVSLSLRVYGVCLMNVRRTQSVDGVGAGVCATDGRGQSSVHHQPTTRAGGTAISRGAGHSGGVTGKVTPCECTRPARRPAQPFFPATTTHECPQRHYLIDVAPRPVHPAPDRATPPIHRRLEMMRRSLHIRSGTSCLRIAGSMLLSPPAGHLPQNPMAHPMTAHRRRARRAAVRRSYGDEGGALSGPRRRHD